MEENKHKNSLDDSGYDEIFDNEDEMELAARKSSPNTIQIKSLVSAAEKYSMDSGYVCKDPLNTSSYTIKWPEPDQLQVLLIKKPHDAAIDEWSDKMIG